jgi:exoribonuclease R
MKTFKGIISVNSRGVGFLDDIEIPNENLLCALNGDEVEARLTGKKSQRGKELGEVVKIISRKREKFVGVIEKDGIIHPDDWRCYTDFKIAKGTAKINDKVLFKMLSWTNPRQTPEAEIIEIIGKAGEHDTEMRAVALARGFSTSFPSFVESEAENTKRREKEIFAEEMPKRRDFRDILTFTIDPADAKDFDDALSLREITKHNIQNTKIYEVGVHIADVSFFVREGTALNNEARDRGFSVYLVDRTIPMLPEILSNDLCSLNPNEDKFAFSAVFEIDENARVLSRWFDRTIIRSQKRFSYEEAQEMLNVPNLPLFQGGVPSQRGEGAASVNTNHHPVPTKVETPLLRKGGDKKMFEALHTLNCLAKIMSAKNNAAGAIDFATDEVKFELDKNGKPLRIYKKPHLETHKLIEEWMLLANREVAEFLNNAREKHGKKSPVLYRVHDLPDSEKIAELALFVKALGHHLPLGGKRITGKDLQQLFKKIEGEAEEALIKKTALRTMSKAIYSTKNIGHFGLAMPFYTHFTSPIRRYADLMVHRMLAEHLHGKKMEEMEWNEFEKLAEHITEKEIEAAEAERESIKMKQVEYMSERIGKEFSGTISGVTEWGIYIEENDTKSEGMVALRNIEDDFYTLNERQYCVIGSRTKKKYSLGDRVKFKVIGADIERKTLDFQIV